MNSTRCDEELTAAGEVVCVEQQRRRAVTSVSSWRVAAGMRAATILQFTFINVWVHTHTHTKLTSFWTTSELLQTKSCITAITAQTCGPHCQALLGLPGWSADWLPQHDVCQCFSKTQRQLSAAGPLCCVSNPSAVCKTLHNQTTHIKLYGKTCVLAATAVLVSLGP